jgi:hypothetical protein
MRRKAQNFSEILRMRAVKNFPQKLGINEIRRMMKSLLPAKEDTMVKSKKFRGILVLALFLGIAAAGYSFDSKSFPDPIQKGSLLISPGFGIGTFFPGITASSSSALVEGLVAVDYALPIDFPLTLGGEIGFSGSKLKSWGGEDFNSSFLGIPILARVAWHPNWEIKNLDTYLLAKLGFDIGFWTGDMEKNGSIKNPHGFVYGFNVGLRYFFTPAIGAYVEGGYEYHFLRYKDDDWGGIGLSGTWPAFGAKFITLGATFKVKGRG